MDKEIEKWEISGLECNSNMLGRLAFNVKRGDHALFPSFAAFFLRKIVVGNVCENVFREEPKRKKQCSLEGLLGIYLTYKREQQKVVFGRAVFCR